MKVLVTGGAGFIGSHVVDRLVLEGFNVKVYDNFKTGKEIFLSDYSHNSNVPIIKEDLLNFESLLDHTSDCEMIFHLAANADVKGGIINPTLDFNQNTIATKNVLECMRINKIKKLVFSSSATVYGNPDVFPTPEDYNLIQTSTYGASKSAGESMIQAYSEYYGIKSWTFRFVSWIGERYTHGVIFDFMRKLKKDSSTLEILGDGTQNKSFLYVKDGVEAIFKAINLDKGEKSIFNLGNEYGIDVVTIADIICEELGISEVKYVFKGENVGWKGDSPKVLLDLQKIKDLGWKPTVSIEEGIRRTVSYLSNNIELLSEK